MSHIQTWHPDDYHANARFVSDLGEPVLELLAPQVGERILDLGCGDGALTERLIRAGARAIGIDTSAELVAAAVARGLDARVLDAHALPFRAEFDAVFTNAVLHWIEDLDVVLAAVHRALHPGGRFVGEFGGHGCVAAICTALQAVCLARRVDARLPWTFPTADAFAERLAAAGFEPLTVQLIPRPTPLPSGMLAWLRTFAQPVVSALPESDREAALEDAVNLLRWSLCDESGLWTADYIRLRFSAVRRVE